MSIFNQSKVGTSNSSTIICSCNSDFGFYLILQKFRTENFKFQKIIRDSKNWASAFNWGLSFWPCATKRTWPNSERLFDVREFLLECLQLLQASFSSKLQRVDGTLIWERVRGEILGSVWSLFFFLLKNMDGGLFLEELNYSLPGKRWESKFFRRSLVLYL